MLKEYNKKKKKSKILRLNRPSDLARVAKVFDRARQIIEDFSLFIKQCYDIVFWKKNELKIYNYFIKMTEKDISQEFRLTKIKEIYNYFIKKVDQNELLSNNIKKVCTTLNYIEHFLT